MYQLYWYPGTCSRVPLVALEEIREPYDAILEDRMAASSAFLRINPKGSVPVLVAGERVITENLAIQQFLARSHPAANLLPAGDLLRDAEVLEMQSWFASTIHPLVRQLRVPQWYSGETRGHTGLMETAASKLTGVFEILEARLDGRAWLFDDWSILDAYLLWLWFRATGSGFDSTAFPRCAAHAHRCEERPSVSAVLEREEQEFARLRADGMVPSWVRDFQAGRVRAVSL
jgi:glutathione S-transferase